MNAKYISIIALLLLAIAISLTWFRNEETPTIDSLRTQAQEALKREEEATKARLEREDNLYKAIYLECFNKATSETGSRFENQQKEAYECWRTKTNGTGKLAPASEPPLRGINLNSSSNVTNKSTVGSSDKESSRDRSEIQPTIKAQGKQMAISDNNRGKVPQGQILSQSGKTSTKGENKDYWLAYEASVNLIRKWEGLRLKAYWDFSHCSIGYGFSSPCGKTITQKEADKMLSDRLHSDLKTIRSDFPKLRPEAQGALASFKHNCPAGYDSVRKNGLKYHSQWCRTAGGERLQGLVNRRAEEQTLIFNK